MQIFTECFAVYDNGSTSNEINIKETFIFSCENDDDDNEIVHYFLQKFPVLVEENKIDASRAAIRSDNVNILSFFISEKNNWYKN